MSFYCYLHHTFSLKTASTKPKTWRLSPNNKEQTAIWTAAPSVTSQSHVILSILSISHKSVVLPGENKTRGKRISLYKGKVMVELTFYIMACPNSIYKYTMWYFQSHWPVSVKLNIKITLHSFQLSKNVSADSLIIVLLLIYAHDHKQLDLKRLWS